MIIFISFNKILKQTPTHFININVTLLGKQFDNIIDKKYVENLSNVD